MGLVESFDIESIFNFIFAVEFAVLTLASFSGVLEVVNIDVKVRNKLSLRKEFYSAYVKAYRDRRLELEIPKEEESKEASA